MFLGTLLLTVIFITLSGAAMALRFYKADKAPSCSSSAKLGDGFDCPACEVSNGECSTESKDAFKIQ